MRVEELLFEIFGRAGQELYLVGGTVRDRLLNLPSTDLDFATDAEPCRTVDILTQAGIRTYDVGRRFGTITAVVESGDGPAKAEITTFRSERYEKGSRKPRVRFGPSLENDLLRRDFTINAMAMDHGGSLVDPSGGQGDLEAGILRTPADPQITMAEDPLRMLRAVRFSGRFGFSIHPDLEAAIRSHVETLREVSVERWLMELEGMLELPGGSSSASCMSLLAGLGLLQVVIPELIPLLESDREDQGPCHIQGVWSHSLCVLARTAPRLDLRWAALFHDSGKPFRRTVDDRGGIHYHGHPETGAELTLMAGSRLRFPKARRLAVSTLVRLHQRPAGYRPEWTSSAVRKLSRDAGDLLGDLLDLSEADSSCRAPGASETRLSLLAELRSRLSDGALSGSVRLVPAAVGQMLASMLGPGRKAETGRMLEVLEDLVVDGRIPRDSPPGSFIDILSRLFPGLRDGTDRNHEDA